MSQATNEQHYVQASRKEKVVYEFTKLLGVFGSWVKKSAEKIDDDLYIDIYDINQYDKIFINGKEFKI